MALQPQDPEHRRVGGGGDCSPIDASCKKFDVKTTPMKNITSIGANNGRAMWQPTTPISSTSPSVIYTPSPVLKGVSYASATKAFIPPLPYNSSPTAVATKHEKSSDDQQSIASIVASSTDIEQSSINDAGDVCLFKDKPATFIEVIQDTASANRGTICKILSVMCLAWLIQMRREQPPTSILSLITWISLVILIQSMDIPSKVVTACGIRCTHFISSLFLLPELEESKTKSLITIVRFIILSGLIQTAYQLILSSIKYQNKCKEEIARREEEALILAQQRELEQHALKVWQENERRKQQEEATRIEQQRLLKEQEILAKQYNCHGSSRRDDQKRKYLTHADAEEAIASMRLQGKDKDLTLMSYYNPVYGRWFIGRAGWMFNNEDMCSNRSTPTPLVGKSQAIGCM